MCVCVCVCVCVFPNLLVDHVKLLHGIGDGVRLVTQSSDPEIENDIVSREKFDVL